MAAYRRVDDLPAGWLPVHRDQLRSHRLVLSTGSLYLYLLVVIDLLSITRLQLVSCDVMQLNLVICQRWPESGYRGKMQLSWWPMNVFCVVSLSQWCLSVCSSMTFCSCVKVYLSASVSDSNTASNQSSRWTAWRSLLLLSLSLLLLFFSPQVVKIPGVKNPK